MAQGALPFSTAASMEYRGWSPLRWASRNGDVAMVRLLLKSGLHVTTVVAATPPSQWIPYAITVFHQNSALLSALETGAELAANLGHLGLTTMTTAVGPGQKYHGHQCDGYWLVRHVLTKLAFVVPTDVASLGYMEVVSTALRVMASITASCAKRIHISRTRIMTLRL